MTSNKVAAEERLPTAPVHVVHVVETLNPGGLENVVATVVERLDRRRYSSTVIVLSEAGSLVRRIEATGTKVHVIGKRPGFDMPAARELRRIVANSDVDLVHTHNPIANHWTVIATMGLGRGVPIIVSEHSIHYSGRIAWFYPWVRTVIGLRNQAIVGVCDAVTASHAAIDPLNRGKYVTIHNGIDPVPHIPEGQLSGLRTELGVGHGRYVLGTIGNLRPAKAHGDLLAALSILVTRGCDAVLVVAGEGPLRRELAIETERLGLSDRVRWLGSRSDVPQLLSVFDAFVLSSRREGFPVAVIEAASAGVPVVATDVGGVREVIRTGETGVLVPPASPGALADGLQAVLTDRTSARRMAETARAEFDARFTAEIMVRQTQALYDRVLAGRLR